MTKFVVIYHAPASALETMKDATPEDMKKGMEPWMAWAAKCGSALVDMGSPLISGQNLTKSGSSTSGRNVVGYSVLESEDMEAAKALLDGHPHLEWTEDCEIEVHESMPLPM